MKINSKNRNLVIISALLILLILTIGVLIFSRYASKRTPDIDEKAIHMLLEKEVPSFGNIQ